MCNNHEHDHLDDEEECPGCLETLEDCVCEDECDECGFPNEDCECEDNSVRRCGICDEPLTENCDCEPRNAYGEADD